MKIAIYTVLTGGYENLMQPLVCNEHFDFVCFSNDIFQDQVGVWQIKKFAGRFPNKQLESRYPKMHPWIILSEYEYSVYMDANIRIVSQNFYHLILQKIKTGVQISGIKHPFRNCLYLEGYEVISYGLENFRTVIHEMRFIHQEGFPRRFGMYEANIILRKHADEKIQKQCELWWKMINRYSKRDQLSYSYTLWKFDIDFDYLIPENQSARNCPWLYMKKHVRMQNIWGKQFKRIGKFLYRKIIGYAK